MYIDGRLTKFRKYLLGNKYNYDEKNNNSKMKKEIIIKYVFDHKLTTLNYMFFASRGITSIKFVNVDTSYITEMIYTFSDCRYLIDLDLSCFNTKRLKNVYNCFFGSLIKQADLSSFNFDNIETFGAFFGRGACPKLILSKKNYRIKLKEIFRGARIYFI